MKLAAHNKHYFLLLFMTVLHFIAMYILMYAMVDSFANVYTNRNQLYMAGLMTSPMIIIELILMSSMYPNKKWNLQIIIVSAVALLAFFVFIRQQTIITNEQFLRSMIPHHAGAILMCERSSFTDPEIKELCPQIIENQKEEIDQMKNILHRLTP